MSRPAPSPPPVKGLAVPEDDPSPDTPLQVFLKSDIQTPHSDFAPGAYSLGLGQLARLLGEEKLVAPLLATSSVLL